MPRRSLWKIYSRRRLPPSKPAEGQVMRLAAFAQRLLLIAGGEPVLPRCAALGHQRKARPWHLLQCLPDIVGNVGGHPELRAPPHHSGERQQVIGRDEAAPVVASL